MFTAERPSKDAYRIKAASHLIEIDLGLVLARCGLSQPAAIWLDRYLKTNPDDPKKSQIRELLGVLTS